MNEIVTYPGRRLGKSHYFRQALMYHMQNMKPGQKILIIEKIDKHTVITRNNDQIEDKRDNKND